MSIKEKYEKLLQQYIIEEAISFTFVREKGLQDEYFDFRMRAMKKMIPNYMGGTLKIFKALSRGRAFKQILNQLVNTIQMITLLSELEVKMVSDQEVIMTINDCSHKRKLEETAKKAGLDLNPIAFCGFEARNFPEYLKEFGVDMKVTLEKDGCTTTVKFM
jgi:hypothetical protein